jgi:RimJ/RimL family protein N-acetyltransferase
MSVPETIATRRLVLRRPRREDAAWMFANYAADPQVTRHLHWPAHQGVEETVAFLDRCDRVWREGTAHPWVLEIREAAQPIGMVEIRHRPPKVDIGYVLAPAHRGHGYMTEAVAHLREWALSLPDVHRFWAVCAVENTASRRVLERAGLALEGTLKRWEWHGDEPVDVLCFAAVR